MHRVRTLAWALACLLVIGAIGVCAQEGQTPPKQEKTKEQKKTQKKAEPARGPGDSADVAVQERRAISRVLRALADALEGNSPRRVVDALDERFYDFPRFEDQVTEFLKQNAEMRIFLREASGEVKGDRATLIVDAEMAYRVKDDPSQERKRKERIQFDFVRTDKGWKIYEINPRSFFTP